MKEKRAGFHLGEFSIANESPYYSIIVPAFVNHWLALQPFLLVRLASVLNHADAPLSSNQDNLRIHTRYNNDDRECSRLPSWKSRRAHDRTLPD